MSNYIKIEMEGGTALTGTLTPEGGGTISGYDARNGVGIFTSSGQGAGATCNITIGGRVLSSVPLTGWGGSTGTASGTGATAATGTGGSGAGTTDPTFTVENNATDAEVTLVGGGDNLKVDDIITIPADTVSGTSQWSSPLTYVVTDSDLADATVSDLIVTIASGGTGYANGDLLFLDIQASGPANELSWSAVITMQVTGLTGYDDGPFVLVPIDNAWFAGKYDSATGLKPMSGDNIDIYYQWPDVNKAGTAPMVDKCTITFNSTPTAAQRRDIMEDLNSLILQASAAENSQPTLNMRNSGVKGKEVSFS